VAGLLNIGLQQSQGDLVFGPWADSKILLVEIIMYAKIRINHCGAMFIRYQ
jgi:hypothetical protein